MNWIIYFTNYGNCKKVADLVEKKEKSAKQEVKIENGEVMAPKDVAGDSPAVIYFGTPIHHHQLSKRAKGWLNRLAKEIKVKDDATTKREKGTTDPAMVKRWHPKVAIFYTHRFSEDDFKKASSEIKSVDGLLKFAKRVHQNTNRIAKSLTPLQMKKKVKHTFGVSLKEEIQFVGEF